MRKLTFVFFIFMISVNVFGQKTELKEALDDLKKDFRKTAKSTSSKNDRTLFRPNKFEGCTVTYEYFDPNQEIATFDEFAPISSSTGTFNKPSNDNPNNSVYVRDKQNGGTVTRNESLSRSNKVKSGASIEDFKKIREWQFDFSFIAKDSISIIPTENKSVFALKFEFKQVTEEYKIQENYIIYLNAGSQQKAEQTLAKFNLVTALCQSNIKNTTTK